LQWVNEPASANGALEHTNDNKVECYRRLRRRLRGLMMSQAAMGKPLLTNGSRHWQTLTHMFTAGSTHMHHVLVGIGAISEPYTQYSHFESTICSTSVKEISAFF
jgi:hypothetical protein